MQKRRKVFTKADLLHTLAVGKGRSLALLEMSRRSLSPPPHWQHKKSRHMSISRKTLILGSNPVHKIPLSIMIKILCIPPETLH